MNNYRVVDAQNITKTYNKGTPSELQVLKGISLTVQKGEFAAIMGPSGSGKTTLLDILGCLMRPTDGTLWLNGMQVDFRDERALTRLRQSGIGFIFQQYNLIPSSSALANVELPLRLNGVGAAASRQRATELLQTVGLGHRLSHQPGRLSGGEQQRVAIARALANDPPLLLADEPTGNLDTKTGETIMDILQELHKRGYTIIMITHDTAVARHADKVIKLKDGYVVGAL